MSTAPNATRRTPKGLDEALTVVGALLAAALILALAVGEFSFQHAVGPAGTGSGVAAAQTRSLQPFTRVDLAGDNNVILHVGAKQSVVVHADRNMLDRVTTRVRSGGLVIDTTPGNLAAKSPMFVEVSVPSLDGIALEGAGNIAVIGIDGPSLTVDLSGGGNIEVTGTTAKLDVTIGGEGTAQLGALVARDATAELSGNGTIMLTATRSLSAIVSGTGTISYDGNPPHVTQNVTGSGTIIPG